MPFANRLNNVETSAIRDLFKLLGKPGTISLAGGFPDRALFDIEGIRAASQQALQEDPGAALQYGATEGYQPLREQPAAFMAGKAALDIRPEDLIVTTGSQQALDLLGKTLIGPGDKVIVEGPTFLATIQCFRLYGADLIGAPTDANGVDTGALEKLIAEHRPKLVYLIPTFGNPSGATLSLARRRQVLEMAVRHQTLIVEDDPYGELYFNAPPPPRLLSLSATVPGSRALLVHCGSLSKVLAPGLRLGWMLAMPELLAKATMCKQFSDAHTTTFPHATPPPHPTPPRAPRSLGAAPTPATLAGVRKVYAGRAQAMVDALRGEIGAAIEFVPPQGGLFVWARLTGADGRQADGNALARRAIEKGVAFVPGAPFFCTHPDQATLRLSFATADEQQIRAGVSRLARARWARGPGPRPTGVPSPSAAVRAPPGGRAAPTGLPPCERAASVEATRASATRRRIARAQLAQFLRNPDLQTALDRQVETGLGHVLGQIALARSKAILLIVRVAIAPASP